jgi:NAD(P)-dependent dehydrogenase (short-subunit alcohol dehydrogenase family)
VRILKIQADKRGPTAVESVLITGCSSGFGLETSLYLAEHGIPVYATVQYPEEQSTVLKEATARGVSLDRLKVLQLDVTDQASIESAVEAIVAETGGIYGLVNNAGLGQRGCFEDVSDAEMRQLFEVNFFGVLAVTRQVLPHMRAAGQGRIITMSSVGGRVASFGLSGYCASKFALEGFGEALALEIAPFGLHSILIEPGIIMTPHWTINRGTTAHALDPASPYANMFRRHEAIADRRTRASKIKPVHVAKAVHQALTAKRPKMRYIVGRPASIVVALRRFVPSGLFERVYFGLLLREITRREQTEPSVPAAYAHQ